MTVSQICSLFLQSMVLILSLLLWGQGISKWRDGVAWLPRYASRFELCETRWVLMWFGLSLLVIPEMLRSAWEVSSEDLRSSIQVDACTRLLLVPVVGMLILRRRAAVTSREEHAEEPSLPRANLLGASLAGGDVGFRHQFLTRLHGIAIDCAISARPSVDSAFEGPR